MPRKPVRLLAACGLAALLIATGCTRGDDDGDVDVEVTDAPSPTPAVEAIADFQIVGRIDESLVGTEPPVDVSEVDFDVDLPDADASPDASPDTSPTAEPTPVGERAPEEGVMRIEAEGVNEALRTSCGIETDEFVNVYWTTDTYFEPASILEPFNDIEDRIEERTAGATGVIVRDPSAADVDDDDDALETLEPTADATAAASPTGSPSVDNDADDTDCVLIAEQVGFTSPAIPTARPAPRTAAPTPVRTATPAPTATRTPTPTATEEPDETDEPTDEPTTSPAT